MKGQRAGWGWRCAIYLLLSWWATPLPPAALLAARAWRVGRRRLAATVAGLSFLASLAGCCWVLLAPVGAMAAFLGISVLWALAGVLLAVIERRFDLAPRLAPVTESRLVYVMAWSLSLTVSFMWLAFFLAPALYSAGMALYTKPSMPGRVLLVGCLSLLPCGALVGWCLRVLRAPLRLGAAAHLPFAGWTTITLGILTVGFVSLVLREVGRMQEIESFEGIWIFRVCGGVFFTLAWPVGALWVAHAWGFKSYCRRVLAFTGLATACGCVLFLMSGALPANRALDGAEKAAGAGNHRASARGYRWLVRRLPSSVEVANTALLGAREAFLAGEVETAREFLGLVSEQQDELPLGRQAATADALLLATSGIAPDLGNLEKVDVEPLAVGNQLPRKWALTLTALRTLEPTLVESRIKARLQQISGSAEELELAEQVVVEQMLTAASLFDARLLVVEWRHLGALLQRGLPVLAELGIDDWRLIYWRAAAADAILYLDYLNWSTDDQPADAEEVARIISADESSGSEIGERLAMLARLDAESRVKDAMATRGGALVVLVAAQEAEGLIADLDLDPAASERLLTLRRAQSAFDDGDAEYAYQLAMQLPEGQPRREILALLAPRAEWLRQADELAVGRSQDALTSIRGELSDGHGSGWFLHRAVATFGAENPPDCSLIQQLRGLRTARIPSRQQLATLATAASRRGDLKALDRWARQLLLFAADDDEQLLALLATVAKAPGVEADPELRDLLQRVLGKISFWVIDAESDFGSLRSGFFGYRAARAVLADSPGQRLRWWRRAAEQEPKDAVIWQRLAAALDELGLAAESATAARHARSVAIQLPCSAPHLAAAAGADSIPGGAHS